MRFLAVPVMLVVLLGGTYLVNDLVRAGFYGSFAVTAGWFVVAGAVAGKLVKDRPSLRWPVRATTVATALVIGGWVVYTSNKDTVVDEQVVTAAAPAAPPAAGTDDGQQAAPEPAEPQNVLLAEGGFETLAHESRGTARVIRLADGGARLTFTGFRTDPGPDLRVYVLDREVDSDGDVEGFVDVGGLKGNRGDQQYDIEDIDPDEVRSVVIWCRAFSVAFARANLAPA